MRSTNSIRLSSLIMLSRAVSHALRHDPKKYGLAFDSEGWVLVEALLTALRQERPEWTGLTSCDLEDMIRQSDKIRHEICGNRIRALYGHSVLEKLERKSAAPPEILFHGTNETAFEKITREGLKAMARQHVHLSVDEVTARAVALRRTEIPVILRIEAGRAFRRGLPFFQGDDSVWLVDALPPEYISRVSSPSEPG